MCFYRFVDTGGEGELSLNISTKLYVEVVYAVLFNRFSISTQASGCGDVTPFFAGAVENH